MTLKLSELLFEEQSPKKLHRLFEEAEQQEDQKSEPQGENDEKIDKKSIPVEGNIQELSKSTLEKVSKFIAQKIDSIAPDIDTIDAETLKKPLGIFDFQKLKKLSKIPIKNLRTDPMQVTGEQQQGLTNVDFKKYEQEQIIPVFIRNADLENVGGEKSGEEFAAMFFIPPLFSVLEKDNYKQHAELFEITPPKKGEVYIYTEITKLPYVMIKSEEVEGMQKMFKTGNTSAFKKLQQMQGRRRSTASDAKKGDSEVAQNESLLRLDLENLHENSLTSLLYEKKSDDADLIVEKTMWQNIKDVFGKKDLPMDKSEHATGVTIDADKLSQVLDTGNKEGSGVFGSNVGANQVNNPAATELQKIGILPNDENKLGADNWDTYGAPRVSLSYTDAANNREIEPKSDPFTNGDSTGSVGMKTYLPAINRQNLNLIANEVLNDKKRMDATRLLKFLPDIGYGILDSSSSSIRGYEDDGNDIVPAYSPKHKYVRLTFSSNKSNAPIRYEIPGTSFKINIPRENNYEAGFNVAGISEFKGEGVRFVPFNLTDRNDFLQVFQNFYGEDFERRIAQLANIFNDATKSDENMQRIYKAANFVAAILRHYGSERFLAADIKDEYKKITKLDLNDDIKGGSGNGFNTTLRKTATDVDQQSQELQTALNRLDELVNTSGAGTSDFDNVPEIDSSGSADDHKDAIKDYIPLIDEIKLEVESNADVELKSYMRDLLSSLDEIKKDFQNAINTSGSDDEIKTACRAVFDHYGQSAAILNRIIDILKSVVKGNSDNTPMSGEGQTQRSEKNLSRKELSLAIRRTAKDKMGKIAQYVQGDYTIKSNYTINDFLKQVVDHLQDRNAEDIVLNLDEYLERAVEGDDFQINYNKVARALESDSVDLITQIPEYDEESYDSDLKDEFIKVICKGVEGIIGEKASILDHHQRSNNLLTEAVVLSSLGLALALFTSGREIQKWGEIKDLFNQYYAADNSDRGTYTTQIVQSAKDLVVTCVRAYVGLYSVKIFLEHEEDLNNAGIRIQLESEAGERLKQTYDTSKSRKNLKQNLNELGEDIYSTIIDSSYEFKSQNKIGQYFSESDLENVLISSFFEENSIARNKFAHLISILQQESKSLNDGYIYHNGIRSLIFENKKKPTSYEINKLRTQLSDIISKEVDGTNFRSKLNQGFVNAIKKAHKKFGSFKKSMFAGKKKHNKKVVDAFCFVLDEVLGIPRDSATEIIEDLNLVETIHKDFARLMLESNSISLLVEMDTPYAVFKNAQGAIEAFYKSDSKADAAKGISSLIFDPKNTDQAFALKRGAATAVNSIQSSMQGATPLTGADAVNALNSMKAQYDSAGQAVSGFGGFNPDTSKKIVDNFFGTPFPDAGGEAVKKATQSGVGATGIGDISMNLSESLAAVSSVIGLINLASAIGRWKADKTLKGMMKENEISAKKLSSMQWSNLAGVALSEIICQTLLANKDALAEQGVKIKGTLKAAQSKTADQKNLSTGELAAKLKASNPKLKGKEIQEKDITNYLEKTLTTVCTSIIKQYDKERYDKETNYADTDTLKKVDSMTGSAGNFAFGALNIATLGLAGFLKGKASDEDLASRVSGSKVKSNREKHLFKSVRNEVNAIVTLILGLVKSKKGLTSDGLILGRLDDLLFESTLLENNSNLSISADDLKDRLEATGILIYGADIDPDSDQFKKAENRLVGTIATILKNDFAIEVTNMGDFKSMNLAKAAVQQSIDQNAKAGTSASDELKQAVSGAGLPASMNAPANMDQMAGIVNMMGGNPMMMFMMMMMNPQFMQMMMKMQNSGSSTMQDMAQAVAKENPEIGEFEKDFAEALKDQRDSLPLLGKSAVKRLIGSLKKSPLEKIENVRKVSLSNTIDLSDNSTILRVLRGSFNLTNKDQRYSSQNIVYKDLSYSNTGNIVEDLASLICNNFYDRLSNVDLENNITFREPKAINGVRCTVWYACVRIAEQVLEIDQSASDACKDFYIEYYDTFNERRGSKNYSLNDINTFADVKNTWADIKDAYKSLNIEVNEISSSTTAVPVEYSYKDKDNFDRFIELFKKAFDNAEDGVKGLKESRNRYNKPVLRKSPVKKSKVINESEFLKKEFKRLWKL